MTQTSDKPEPGSPKSDASASDAIPEVEAEIVTGETDAARKAAPFDDAQADAAPADDSIAAAKARPLAPLRTPGVILFGVFALVALAIFAWWRLNPDSAQAPSTAPETDQAQAAPVQDALAVNVDEPAAPAAQPLDPAPDTKIANAPAGEKETPQSTPETASGAGAGFLPPVEGEGAAKLANPVEEGAKEAMRRFAEADAARAAAATETPLSAPIDPAGDAGQVDPAAAMATESATPDEAQEAPPLSPAPAAADDALAAADPETAAPAPAGDDAAASVSAVASGANDRADIDRAAVAELRRAFADETGRLQAALDEERRLSAEREREIEALKQTLAARDAEVAEELAEMRAAVAKIEDEASVQPMQTLRASFALSALKRALDQGAPYRDELTMLAQFAPDAEAALGAFADSGVVSEQVLRQRFEGAARAAMSAAAQEKAGGGVRSVLARAANIVSVRPAVPTAGDEPGAILSRAEHALEQGETAFALLQLEDLPVAAQEAMADWIADARARAEMESAVGLLEKRLVGNAG